MNKYIISVESTADLPKAWLEQYEIYQVDLPYSINNEEHLSSTDISPKEYFSKMREGVKTSTSQVNLFQAKEFFTELLKQGRDILHISFSSALSGTYNNLKKAADELNETSKNKIVVVNSLCASTGQGLLALIAREKSEGFKTIDEFGEYIESIKLNICHLFIVDSLKYLCRTGRVSKVTAAIGTVLQIKPILHVDNNGCLVSMAKVISRKKSISSIAEKVAMMKNNISDRIIVTHADCEDEAKIIQQLIFEKTKIKPEVVELGCVIGSHSGPGTIAVFFTSDVR